MARKHVPSILVVLAYHRLAITREATNGNRVDFLQSLAAGVAAGFQAKPVSLSALLGPAQDEYPYDTLARWTGQPVKVCDRAMERDHDRGLVDYGTTLRGGWLTDAGKALLATTGPALATVAQVEERGAAFAASIAALARLRETPCRMVVGLDMGTRNTAVVYSADLAGVRNVELLYTVSTPTGDEGQFRARLQPSGAEGDPPWLAIAPSKHGAPAEGPRLRYDRAAGLALEEADPRLGIGYHPDGTPMTGREVFRQAWGHDPDENPPDDADSSTPT